LAFVEPSTKGEYMSGTTPPEAPTPTGPVGVEVANGTGALGLFGEIVGAN